MPDAFADRNVKEWLIAELTNDPAISQLVPAFGIAGMTNPDETPTNPGAYIHCSSSTVPEKFYGLQLVTIASIASSEENCFALHNAIAAKFIDFGGDKARSWHIAPSTNHLRITSIRVQRSDNPEQISKGTEPADEVWAATLHLEFRASPA